MEPGGLSRRRAHGHHSSAADSDGEDGRALSAPSTPASPLTPPFAPFRLAGPRSYRLPDADHTIAFDPRDLSDAHAALGEPRPPRLTIMEEVLLLGMKDHAGYLSFWNDSISYSLRGAVLLELALRGRIGIAQDPNRFEWPVQERGIEIVSRQPTGDVLLDETLRHMALYEAKKAALGSRKRKTSVQWADVLAGETWDPKQITYQLRAVRERLAKGLADKGVLRTEKSTMLFFDMTTHPLEDISAKQAVIRRVHSILIAPQRGDSKASGDLVPACLDPDSLYAEERHPVPLQATRALCTVCTALAANVLENALTNLSYMRRDAAFERADALIAELGQWPMAPTLPTGRIGDPSCPVITPSDIGAERRGRRVMPSSIGEGSVTQDDPEERDDGGRSTSAINSLLGMVRNEMETAGGPAAEGQFEAIAGILGALARMDCLVCAA